MNTEEKIKKQKELIEEIGRFHDDKGMQPIAARILGLLMVMDKEQFTFDEIIDELHISKASASNTIKMLELQGLVEYITLPGDRKKYYRLKQYEDLTMIEDFKEKLNSLKDMLERILELKLNKDSRNSVMFNSIIDMISFFMGRIEKLEKEYKNVK